MRFNDLTLGLLVAILGVAVILSARGFPLLAGMDYGPAFFPILIGAGFCLCGLLLAAAGLRRRGASAEPALRLAAWTRDPLRLARVAAVLGAVALYALASPRLGLLLTLFLIALTLSLLFGARPLAALLLALALPPLIHYLFAALLRVPLPRGPLEQWLL